ncbi:SPP1 gp7 family putative phage head morphogenesis protein [Haloferula luteola]|uniref:SPP1 gp7 family putative phage head morphogenesis protein n=1 Tax=Haloferula luteola TaxID=595692 RepID=A0A840VAX2_9BACT|nr:minor capsid protein [Haloferula luteola]MBB5351090.1 SPP1 gp7 family putative phage head morphogenesis protein [Haloferula luteola]
MNLLHTPIPHEEGSELVAAKVPARRDVFDGLLPELRARAFTVTGVEDLNVLARVRDLTAELPVGGDFDELKSQILDEISPWIITATEEEERAKQLGEATRRAEMLLKMHGWQAYAQTQDKLIREEADAFPYSQYLDSGDHHVRPSHSALGGKIFPTLHPFWENHTPPWEFGCRCDKVPLTADEVEEIRAAEQKLPPEQQSVVDGYRLQEVESQGVLRIDDGGTVDIRTPREKQGSTGYEWRPGDAGLDLQQILARHTPQDRQVFESWARSTDIGEGRTVWETFEGTPAASAPQSSPAPAIAPAAAPVSTPRQSPVSAGLPIASRGEVARTWKEALSAIDSVHDDGVLPGYAARRAPKTANHLGVYHFPKKHLAIREDGPWRHLTAAHEIGHYLDHQALGSPNVFASADPASPVHAICAMLRQTPTCEEIRASRIPVRMKHYFLSSLEIWARAYAQFIAEESATAELSADLLRVSSSIESWRQWPPHEFAPARAAIRQLFREKGWML